MAIGPAQAVAQSVRSFLLARRAGVAYARHSVSNPPLAFNTKVQSFSPFPGQGCKILRQICKLHSFLIPERDCASSVKFFVLLVPVQ
jgi:hypothetical protein